MLITVNRAELLATVKRATTIAPPDSPLDVLKGVLLESDSARKMLTVTSTNLEVALVEKIPCSAQEDGALVYSARTLAEMLQRLPEAHSPNLTFPSLRILSRSAAFLPWLSIPFLPRLRIRISRCCAAST